MLNHGRETKELSGGFVYEQYEVRYFIHSTREHIGAHDELFHTKEFHHQHEAIQKLTVDDLPRAVVALVS